MKAIQMDDYGGPDVLHLRDISDPVAGAGEIVADIHAASINPVDWKIRNGARRGTFDVDLPHVLGVDFSGVVRTVGEGVTDLGIGDAVFGVVTQVQQGCYAEAVAVKADMVGKNPDSLSHAEAASLALVGTTALVSMEDEAELSASQMVLIHAGAGGVGGFAIQYAKHVGATVWSTASAANHDYVKGLGADEVIDYNAVDFAEAAPPCDVVYDTVGGDVQAKSVLVLKPGGRLVHVAPPPADFKNPRDDIEIIRPNVGRDRAHMERIAELVGAGAVRPMPITHMPLAETAAAHELSQTGHVRGKIVLDVR
jgi:NADPH:quinone reductase-like Zn-dependent oxidoreductase